MDCMVQNLPPPMLRVRTHLRLIRRVLGIPGVTKCQAHAARATAAALLSAEAAARAGQGHAVTTQQPRPSPHADLAAALAKAMDQASRAAPLVQAHSTEPAGRVCHEPAATGLQDRTTTSGFNRNRYAPYCAWGGVHNECQL